MSHDEKEVKRKAQEGLRNTKDPVEELRLQCLARGSSGIKGLSRTFRIMDDDRNQQLNYEEFKTGIQDYGIKMEDKKLKEVFKRCDTDGSGSLNVTEFLLQVRPPMSEGRKNIIGLAYNKLDKTGDGVITTQDLKGVYSVKRHPKYLSGELTEEDILLQFLNSFDSRDKDGVVTKDEFIEYYAGVSTSIDDDAYFDLMMRNAWKL